MNPFCDQEGYMHVSHDNTKSLRELVSNESTSDIKPSITEEICKVKWFKHKRGYGFLSSDTISDDIFLHASAIKSSGIKVDLMHGDIIHCEIKMRGHMQKPEVVKINKCIRKGSDLLDLTAIEGIVKWFNAGCDYGFVSCNKADIFVSGTLLRKSGIAISEFEENTNVICSFLEIDGKKIAYGIKLTDNIKNSELPCDQLVTINKA